MHKFDAAFAEFFEDPIIKRLIATDNRSANALFALRDEEERLWDVERFRTFRLAVSQNEHLFKNKVVVVLRSGLGLLAIWAARAGAARVVCIEDSPAISFIRDRVKAEGLTIECVRSGGADLRPNSVDVLLADWPGYFGLNQDFIYELIRVRDACLKPDGVVMPDRLTLWVAGHSDAEQHRERLGFWDNVYGFAMPSMKAVCLNEAVFERVAPRCLATAARQLRTFDLQTARASDLGFTARVSLEVKRSASKLHGVVLWFDVVFSRCHIPIGLTTSPYKNKTDICNAKLFFDAPVEVGGARLALSVSVRNESEDVSRTRVKVIAGDGERPILTQFYILK